MFMKNKCHTRHAGAKCDDSNGGDLVFDVTNTAEMCGKVTDDSR